MSALNLRSSKSMSRGGQMLQLSLQKKSKRSLDSSFANQDNANANQENSICSPNEEIKLNYTLDINDNLLQGDIDYLPDFDLSSISSGNDSGSDIENENTLAIDILGQNIEESQPELIEVDTPVDHVVGNDGRLIAEAASTEKTPGQKRAGENERESNKKLRMEGKHYLGVTKTYKENVGVKYSQTAKRQQRKLAPRNCTKTCTSTRKCNEVSEAERQEIFNNFWAKMDWGQRRVYISSLVEVQSVKERKVLSENPRRQFSYKYHLMINSTKMNVCKAMFLRTLDMSEWSVQQWARKAVPTGGMHDKQPATPTSAEGKTRTGVKRETVKRFLEGKFLPLTNSC